MAYPENFVKGKIERLAHSSNDSRSKAALANLRKGVGLKPGALPELWREVFDGLDERCYGTGGDPSRETGESRGTRLRRALGGRALQIREEGLPELRRLLPAQAGMIHRFAPIEKLFRASPCAGGDDPLLDDPASAVNNFSPRSGDDPKYNSGKLRWLTFSPRWRGVLS